MTQAYIPSKTFRGIITLLTKMMDLPQTANINVGGENKEYTVFHRIELLNYVSKDDGAGSTIVIKSYPIEGAYSDMPSHASRIEINPEYEFTENRIFWAGAPTKVFKDYMPLNDKKFGALSWCASYERELYHPTFVADIDNPIAVIQIQFDMLKRFEAPEEKRVFVGSVGEDGDFTPSRQFDESTRTVPSSKAIHKTDTAFSPVARSEVAPPAVFRNARTGETLGEKIVSTIGKIASQPAYAS